MEVIVQGQLTLSDITEGLFYLWKSTTVP